MDLLPQVGTEDLDERNLQCRDLAVHEDTSQIQLHLETNIDLNTTKQNGTIPINQGTVYGMVHIIPPLSLLNKIGSYPSLCPSPHSRKKKENIGVMHTMLLNTRKAMAFNAAQGTVVHIY